MIRVEEEIGFEIRKSEMRLREEVRNHSCVGVCYVYVYVSRSRYGLLKEYLLLVSVM